MITLRLLFIGLLHCAKSCRNKPMQLDVDEVCNSDLQPIFAGEADEPTTFDVYDKPNKVYSCEEIPKDCQDDEGIQTLDGSR